MRDAAAGAPNASVLPWLRCLWGGDWRLEALPPPPDAAQPKPAPVLRLQEGGRATLYLPPAAHTADWSAAAAHAAAHRRFGGDPQDRKGLKPVQQALLGVLEDARVEALACTELPGLRALWRPYHVGPHARQGQGFEDLLARLSACLLDPAIDDLHPWIAKVRRVFFGRDGRTLALRTHGDVRQAASLLGHDVGQMRLPFNARTYRVHARYRDDNTHLWLPSDEDQKAQVLPEMADPPDKPPPPAPPSPSEWLLDTPAASYPEWDHRIGTYRPAWTQVHEVVLHATSQPHAAPGFAPARRLAQHCRPRGTTGKGHARDTDGDEPHAAALLEYTVALRSGRPPDPRVWQRPAPRPATQAVLLLVDASVSTARDLHAWQQDVRQAAMALQMLGHRSAVWAFGSDGRHRVRLQRLKDWAERCEAMPWGTLQAGGSTRLGAALRHALHLCTRSRLHTRVDGCTVLLLTDGELHDIDVHDRAYLPADLAHAVRELRTHGVRVQALLPAPEQAAALHRALGRQACWRVDARGWGAALRGALQRGS